jgi:glycosyltransferase involved in cell wall biosynthesis
VLDEQERAALLSGERVPDSSGPGVLLVPLSGRLLVPEVAANDGRAGRTAALAEHAAVDVAFIMYDLAPLTMGDVAGARETAEFPLYLEALARASRIATSSAAALAEAAGWKRMLASAGREGPELGLVRLASEPLPGGGIGAAAFRRRIGLDDSRKIVLVVGTHEPRKNHLAVLQAAELLWRKRRTFALVFVGELGPNAASFERAAARLKRRRRNVVLVTDADDELLRAAYDAASFTVFPSLLESFGLPVAESLGTGTPVITSGFGSTKEIADAAGGALLVDPSSDLAIADGIERMLTDTALHARLSAEAAAMQVRRWDEYAEEAWGFLTRGS